MTKIHLKRKYLMLKHCKSFMQGQKLCVYNNKQKRTENGWNCKRKLVRRTKCLRKMIKQFLTTQIQNKPTKGGGDYEVVKNNNVNQASTSSSNQMDPMKEKDINIPTP